MKWNKEETKPKTRGKLVQTNDDGCHVLEGSTFPALDVQSRVGGKRNRNRCSTRRFCYNYITLNPFCLVFMVPITIACKLWNSTEQKLECSSRVLWISFLLFTTGYDKLSR